MKKYLQGTIFATIIGCLISAFGADLLIAPVLIDSQFNPALSSGVTTVACSTATSIMTCAVTSATTLPNVDFELSLTANTITGNATGSTAAPTALAMPSCSTSGSALTWTTSSGVGCNTAIAASTATTATNLSGGSVAATTLTANSGSNVPYMIQAGGTPMFIPPAMSAVGNGGVVLGSEAAAVSLVFSGGTCAGSGVGCPANASGVNAACTGCFGGTAALDVGRVITVDDSSVWKQATITAASTVNAATVTIGSVTIGTTATPTFTTGNWELAQPLPTLFATMSAYVYYPANSVCASGNQNSAGLYWTVFSSSTVGVAYNNTYTSGVPAAPSPVSFTCAQGNGAAPTFNNYYNLYSIPVAQNLLSANGTIEIITDWFAPTVNSTGSAGTKGTEYQFSTSATGNSATPVSRNSFSTNTNESMFGSIRNLNNKAIQLGNINPSALGYLAGGAPYTATVDTSAAISYVNILGDLVTTTNDWLLLTGVRAWVTP